MINAKDIIFKIQMMKGQKGDTGEKGKDGATISKVETIGTEGNSIQYKITMTDGSTTNFSVPLSDSINAWMNAHPELTRAAVDAWMADHPEATTTINDGAVSTAKIANGAVSEDKLAAAVAAKLNNTIATGLDVPFMKISKNDRQICRCIPLSKPSGTGGVLCEKPDTSQPIRVWLTLYNSNNDIEIQYKEITDKSEYDWDFRGAGNIPGYIFYLNAPIADNYTGFIHLQYTGLQGQAQNGLVLFAYPQKECPTTVICQSNLGSYIETCMLRGKGQFSNVSANSIVAYTMETIPH